ncbi:WD40 repeat domain-containing protein [candidate division KSB1 bacterium]|nr:WD40 repeat domain-containing protein [candidate division KSB1 bacterium]
MVMPATQAGLAVLIESMQRNLTFSVSPADGAAAYPELLAQRPMLYLEQNEPEPAKVEQLCRQLMNYLGDEGFYWLCACAVYPMLGWDLTIYLGYRLLDDAGQKLITEERLLRLARLPWLRYGMMPNWWRLRLIQEMGRQGETAVRKALQDLLESAIEEPGQGFILDVARTPGLKRRHWRRILKFLKTTPEESGMHDYVFLTYMSGRRPRRLAVGVPNVLRRFFSNRTKTWFDWLPVAVAGVLIMFSLGLAWLSKSSPYVPPIIPHFREAMAAVNERLRLEGHTDDVRCVAFRPDGRTLASGSEDGSIRLWDVAGGAERRRLEGHTGWIRCIAFSPDGRTLASGSDDGSIRLWDVASGAERARLGGPSGVVYCVAFSPDGRTLASGSADRIVRLWDIASGTERRWLEGHTDDVNSVAFSPDGGTLASGSLDGSIRLWDIASGVVRSILKGESGAIESVAFSPDGATLASGSWDESIRLWDVVSGIELRRLEDQSGGIFSVAFSRDGVTLASGSEDGTVRIWDVASGTERHQLEGHTGWTRSVAFSPDGRTLASGSSDGTIRLWDLVQGQSGDYTSTMPLAYSDQPLQVYADFLSRHPYRLVADSIRGDIQWSDSTQDKMDYPSVLTNGLMQTVGFDTSMFQFVSKDSLPDVAETDFGGKDLAPLFLRIKSKQKIGRIEEAAPFGKTIKADPRAQTDRRLRESSAPPFSRTVDADSIARIDTLKDVLVAPQFNRATDAGSDAQSDTVLNELPNSQFERPANRDSSTQIDTLKDVLVAPQTDKETPPDTRTRTDTLQNEPDVQQKMRTKN